MTNVIGGAEERAGWQSNKFISALKMATAISTDTVDNYQNSMQLTSESESFTLNPSREKQTYKKSNKLWRELIF
jgi:hypothetical protein